MSGLVKLGIGSVLLLLVLSLASPIAASPALDSTVWSGEYFNNVTLAGPPVLLRGDPSIDFFWAENTSPAPGFVGTNNYSVRWTRSIYFPTSDTWVFTTVNDDGMRVWVDDVITMDAWYDQGPTTHTGSIYLTAGWHTVKVEYYNRVLGGTARVSYAPSSAPPPPPANAWHGQYFNNIFLSGSPALVRDDPSLHFDWGGGSPGAAIPNDYFSAKWDSTQNLATTQNYTVLVSSDDGVRVWIDGVLVVDAWYDHSPTLFSATRYLTAGAHNVHVEYYERTGGAMVGVDINPTITPPPPPPPPTGAWHGQFFNNVSLSGSPVFVRDYNSLHFDWGTGSPDPSVPVDNFSAKWDSVQTLPTTGNYNVVVSSDDGVRVWVDGVLVVDAWYDHSPALFTATRYLGAGAHNVHVEYYERTGGAMVGVDLNPASEPPPGGDVIVDDRGPGWQAGGSSSTWRNAATGYGGHAFWTFNNAFTAPSYNWARWYPSLPHAGYYEVFAYIPGGLATTINARYWVYHNNRYDLAPRAQAFFANQWMSLGTYYFNDSGTENVSLADVTYECYLCRTLVFDAVKFSPR